MGKRVYRALFWSIFAVLAVMLVAALRSRRRRPAAPLVVGGDWQTVEVEAISPAQPAPVRLATWSTPPEQDEPVDTVIYETRDAVGTAPHKPADEQRKIIVEAESPWRSSNRPLARRSRPTDDKIG